MILAGCAAYPVWYYGGVLRPTLTYICDRCGATTTELGPPWETLHLYGWVGDFHACSPTCAECIASNPDTKPVTMEVAMLKLQAEFYVKAPEPVKRKKVMSWVIPGDMSLDEAKAAAKDRATRAGYHVTSANFTRAADTGAVAAIVIYVEKSRST